MPVDFGFKPTPKSNLKSSEILKQAKELISDKSKHTKGHYARASNGWNVDPLSADAVCWCSIGAVIKVSGEDNIISKSCLTLYEANPGGFGVAMMNDRGTHEEVMQMFDKAIELAILKGD